MGFFFKLSPAFVMSQEFQTESILISVCLVGTEQARILVWCRQFSRYCDWKEDGRIAVQFSTGISLFYALFRPTPQPTQKAV
jgi:hypothetical protein